MDSKILKILQLFNNDLDFACLDRIIESLEINQKYFFVIYDLVENGFIYFNPSSDQMLGDIPNDYLNKGFQYLQKICHPVDFANLVKDIADVVYSTINNNTVIKSINGGQILRTKNKTGNWQIQKIHLIYLKEFNKKSFSVILGIVYRDILDSETNKLNITTREKQVFKFLSQGFSAKMIADSLNISENTVITHRKNLINKLNVKNSAELIKKGYELYLNY